MTTSSVSNDWSRTATLLMAAACTVAATGCRVEAVEWGQRDAGQEAPATFIPGATGYGVPAASTVDFGRSAPMPTSDLTY